MKEKTLISWCFAGGAIGGMFGMFACHHKTKHLKFRILVPLSLVLWCGIIPFAVFMQYLY
ncbi:MAG: DUF1294 domain-containing protein [Clostridia bacterium]|nr:DUF1294 domain-containing protein [Clostridia bacterium]